MGGLFLLIARSFVTPFLIHASLSIYAFWMNGSILSRIAAKIASPVSFPRGTCRVIFTPIDAILLLREKTKLLPDHISDTLSILQIGPTAIEKIMLQKSAVFI
jgi:hypothetical protein